jgi:hypothetical protein
MWTMALIGRDRRKLGGWEERGKAGTLGRVRGVEHPFRGVKKMTSLGKWGGSGSGHGCRYRALEIRGLGWHQSYQQICMSTPSDFNYPDFQSTKRVYFNERTLEQGLIDKLQGLKYEYRSDITSRAELEQNFREKFQALNRVRLTDSGFARLLDEIVSADVFAASKTLRGINAFTRDDGTLLNYTLVNIKDWCKNHFEVTNLLRINTDNSHHRYDVVLLINGIPVVQIELKTLGVNPRRAMEQIVEYKNDPGNGYTKTLLCFLQLFIVSNREAKKPMHHRSNSILSAA